jgi:hypothetical protein
MGTCEVTEIDLLTESAELSVHEKREESSNLTLIKLACALRALWWCRPEHLLCTTLHVARLVVGLQRPYLGAIGVRTVHICTQARDLRVPSIATVAAVVLLSTLPPT